MTVRQFLFLFSFLSLSAFSQNQQVQSIVEKINIKLVTVEASKSTYQHNIEYKGFGVVHYNQTEKDQKGTVTGRVWEVNLADLDPYTVNEETSRDLINVVAVVRNKQKLIKYIEDGEVKRYDDEIEIISDDINNAREISTLLGSSIPLAQKALETKLNLTTYQELTGWLVKNIDDVVVEAIKVEQSLKMDEEFAGKFIYEFIDNTRRNASKDVYTFNLADLNPNSLDFKISGSQFLLKAENNANNRYINVASDGESKPFTNSVEFLVENVEEGRDLRTVLEKIIPQAEKQIESSYPPLPSSVEALLESRHQVQNITYGEDEKRQSFKPECLSQFKLEEQTPNKTTVIEYTFNLIDINPLALNIDVKGKEMYVKLLTNDKKKLIRQVKDGELSNYDNAFRIYCEDVERGRRLRHALKLAIEKCAAEYKQTAPDGSLAEKIKHVAAFVTNVEEGSDRYDQSLEHVEKDVVKYTVVSSDTKSSTEEIYEFNLSDINFRTIDYLVRGKSISVEFSTHASDKVIKYYKDANVGNYQNTVAIKTNDVETARNLSFYLETIIEGIK